MHKDGCFLPFNITHDNRLVVLAYGEGTTEEIGVDVMKVELPRNETIKTFIEVLDDQVRAIVPFVFRYQLNSNVAS